MLPPVPALLAPEPVCDDPELIPVVMPEPSPDGLAPDVAPRVVWPKAPLVVLPRLAWARPIAGRQTTTTRAADGRIRWIDIRQLLTMLFMSASPLSDFRPSAPASK